VFIRTEESRERGILEKALGREEGFGFHDPRQEKESTPAGGAAFEQGRTKKIGTPGGKRGWCINCGGKETGAFFLATTEERGRSRGWSSARAGAWNGANEGKME